MKFITFLILLNIAQAAPKLFKIEINETQYDVEKTEETPEKDIVLNMIGVGKIIHYTLYHHDLQKLREQHSKTIQLEDIEVDLSVTLLDSELKVCDSIEATEDIVKKIIEKQICTSTSKLSPCNASFESSSGVSFGHSLKSALPTSRSLSSETSFITLQNSWEIAVKIAQSTTRLKEVINAKSLSFKVSEQTFEVSIYYKKTYASSRENSVDVNT
jgi:hypothetical protein